MEIQKKIARCPECGTKYRVPENARHKIAPCAKCGSRFKILFEDEEPLREQDISPESGAVPEPKTEGADDASAENGQSDLDTLGFQLRISEDGCSALLQPPEAFPESVTLTDLKSYLTGKGVVFGLAGDTELEGYLRQEKFQGVAWPVARGNPPHPGKDAEITYHFDTEASKVGTIRQDGAIDYKDKGEIPQVMEGALLAQKIPPVKGTAGRNIFGEILYPDEVRDQLVLPGDNVRTSDDGLQLFAKIGGRPVLKQDGRVAVYPELRIDGDVGLETGHIQFSGHINVRGTIQEGFRVKGGQLTAREIEKAEVDIEGDIDITGGILGSRVKAGGNVRTRYVEASTLQILGDLAVRDEILHSSLEINGALSVTAATGKILASDISARKGIEAPYIGSEASRPCLLTIGVDTQAGHRMEEIDREIDTQQKRQEILGIQIDKLKQEYNNYSGQIANLAQAQDRGLLEQKTLQALMAELEKKNDLDRLTQARWEYESLEKKIRGAEESLNHLMEEQDHHTETILQSQKEISGLEQSIQELLQRREQIKTASEAEKINPVLKVQQVIFGGTVIKGNQATLTVPKEARRVAFKETIVSSTSESGQPLSGWRIVMSDL